MLKKLAQNSGLNSFNAYLGKLPNLLVLAQLQNLIYNYEFSYLITKFDFRLVYILGFD